MDEKGFVVNVDTIAVASTASTGTADRNISRDPTHTESKSDANPVTSAASFRRSTSTLHRLKTRCRFTDDSQSPPVDQNDDDEDPFLDDDISGTPSSRWNPKPLMILQWTSLFLILGFLSCSLSIHLLQRINLWGLHLWKWALLALALVCGRLVSGWAVRIVVLLMERNFVLRRRVLYFVYGLRHAVQNCLWLGLVLLAWHFIFDGALDRRPDSKPLSYITKILLCLLVASFFCLAKTLLVKVLASSFHVSTYFDRIQESLFNQYVIETLSGPPVTEIQHRSCEQKLQNGRLKSVKFSADVCRKEGIAKREEEGIRIDHLHKLNQKNVSAWSMKRLMKVVRYGSLSTIDERIFEAGDENESEKEIRSEFEAKAAAKRIFNNVAKPGSKYIYLVDLMRFLKEDEALKTISLFEGSREHERVSKKSLKNWVINAFRERRALSLTLNDTKTAVNKLHQMVNIIVGIIVFAIWLLILGLATTHFLVFICSQLVVVAFIFGNTLKMIFEAIIFLFVMHPFDVGDRCEVEGVQMIVEEMNILTTIFLRFDNQKISYPNSVLATLPISNIYRSPDMGDSIDFCVHVATPMEKLAVMKERIIRFIEDRKEHWYPGPSVVLKDVDDMNRLKISIWLRHRINYQNMGERWARRELVVQEMIKVLRELEIEYRMLLFDVNLRQMPSLSSNRLPSTWSTCN
ncbi:putative mechanosensitive ion channel MscS, LSM domain superfamily [Dioscorea sansibarensis]